MAKSEGQGLDLTWDLKMTEESDGDFDGQLVQPQGAPEAFISHLAQRCGLSPDQTTRCLAELVKLAGEQLREHPNRYFIFPGFGALILESRPSSIRNNPFTGEKGKTPEVRKLSFKIARPLRNAALGRSETA